MIKTIQFAGNPYPEFQTNGFAARFAFPFAKEVCQGTGYDIGCCKPEWALPGSIPIDKNLPGGYSALDLPTEHGEVDYIFSSHCLEHIPDWTRVLDYWYTVLKPGGTLFLYLPDYSQEYWRPWNNTKHVNILSPEYLRDYLNNHKWSDNKKAAESPKWINVFVSGVDLYNSFMVMAEKN